MYAERNDRAFGVQHSDLGLGSRSALIAAASVQSASSATVNAGSSALAVGTIQQIASQLVSGYWNGDSHHWPVTQGGTLTVDITTLNPSEQSLALEALGTWSHISGIFFQQVSAGAQIVFDDSEGPAGPVAATDGTWSNGIITSEHVHISTSWVTEYGTGLNTYSFQTYIHEIGHALGLGHPGNYNTDATYANDALFSNDAWSTSVMSYFSETENSYFAGQGFTEAFANTPMMADILAIQEMYGLGTLYGSGDNTYGFGVGSGAVCIYDAGGTDWLSGAGYFKSQLINLSPGSFSNINGEVGNVSIALGVVIENAEGGTGGDTILGNDANNVLVGGEGSDTLVGGAGDDTLIGDGPNSTKSFPDTLTGGPGHDTFQDSRANLNGDTITDFSRSDRIVITDASLNGFTFSVSGDQLTYAGGSMTLSGLCNALVASQAPGGGVQIAFAGPPVIISAGAPVGGATVANASSGELKVSAAQLEDLLSPLSEQQPETASAIWHGFKADLQILPMFDHHDLLGWA